MTDTTPSQAPTANTSIEDRRDAMIKKWSKTFDSHFGPYGIDFSDCDPDLIEALGQNDLSL